MSRYMDMADPSVQRMLEADKREALARIRAAQEDDEKGEETT